MYLTVKRLFDIVFGFISLVILLPILLPISIILLLTGEGQVFYLQERIGLNNSTFNIFKFATMLKNSLNMGSGSITLKDDFRVTKVGKYLRKSKINELPQIINIINGDISFVGPRPLVYNTFNAYSDEVKFNIYKSKPGLTGIGSVVFRDEESLISSSNFKDPHVFYKNVIAPYKGELELWYLKNKSFTTDLKIILLTAWVIFFKRSRLYEVIFKDLPRRKFEI